MNSLSRDILTALREARLHHPDYPWVHGQRLQGIAGIRYGARLDELRSAGWQISSVAAPGSSGGWHQYRLDSLERVAPREARVRFDLTMSEIRQLAAGRLPESVIEEAKRIAPYEQVGLF